MQHRSLTLFLNGERSADELWREIEPEVEDCCAALASLLLAGIAKWRHDMLVRKRAAFRNAVEAYEAMLEKPFD